jgi:ubiquinone/menaquinone biosynthesis methyltransferase
MVQNTTVMPERDRPAATLRGALATPAAKRRYVRWLFDRIADRYDLITVLLSYGRDRHWKARLLDRSGAGPGTRALDLACGTGDLAFGLSRRGAEVIALDLTPRMIELACARASSIDPAARGPRFLVGDMLALPFPDEAFDLVTTGYGVRNAAILTTALAEIRRVLRPGGRVLSLDFNRPSNALIRAVYLTYLTFVGGVLGLVLHGRSDTYRYIPATIRRYPGADGVARVMRETGFTGVECRPVLGGLLAIHAASRPAAREK